MDRDSEEQTYRSVAIEVDKNENAWIDSPGIFVLLEAVYFICNSKGSLACGTLIICLTCCKC
jgi:hypothetical protein